MVATCPVCGATFDPDLAYDDFNPRRGEPRRYCSREHARRAAYLRLRARGYYARPELLAARRQACRVYRQQCRELVARRAIRRWARGRLSEAR